MKKELDQFNIGKIVNTVGIKGEITVYPYTDYKERFEELTWIYVESEKYTITKVRYKKEMVILKLKGVDTMNQAETMKNRNLYIDRENGRTLPEDTFFIVDLVGSTVFDEVENEIGILVDVIQNSNTDLYEIKTKDTEKLVLIPVVKQYIEAVDVEQKVIKVKNVAALLDLENVPNA